MFDRFSAPLILKTSVSNLSYTFLESVTRHPGTSGTFETTDTGCRFFPPGGAQRNFLDPFHVPRLAKRKTTLNFSHLRAALGEVIVLPSTPLEL